MSPYVADPLCRGGAECSQRDESGIILGIGTDIGGVEGPQVHQRGMVGVLPAVWHSTKAPLEPLL